jgi:hypothetical protein
MHIGLGIRMSGNRGAGGGFSPNALFASGEAGDWFDPSDLSRMWQDTAGTTAVTADGQTVARIDGQRGVVSLRQSDAAKRPAYKTSAGLHWLQFDGTNDVLVSAATINWGVSSFSATVGVRYGTTATAGIYETGLLGAVTAGALMFRTFERRFRTDGKDGSLNVAIEGAINSLADNTNYVQTQLLSLSGQSLSGRLNGAVIDTTTPAYANVNLSNTTMYVGARGNGSQFLNGNIYFLLIRGALTSGADLTALEGFAAAKTGVTLP